MGSASSCTAPKHNDTHVAQRRAEGSGGSSSKGNNETKKRPSAHEAAASPSATSRSTAHTHPISAPPTQSNYTVEQPPANAPPQPQPQPQPQPSAPETTAMASSHAAALTAPHTPSLPSAAVAGAHPVPTPPVHPRDHTPKQPGNTASPSAAAAPEDTLHARKSASHVTLIDAPEIANTTTNEEEAGRSQQRAAAAAAAAEVKATSIMTPSAGTHPAVHDGPTGREEGKEEKAAGLQPGDKQNSGRHCYVDVLSPPQQLTFSNAGEEEGAARQGEADGSVEACQIYHTLRELPQAHRPAPPLSQEQHVSNLQQHASMAGSAGPELADSPAAQPTAVEADDDAPPPPLPPCSPQIFPYNLPQPALLAASTDSCLCVHKDMLWCVKRADKIWLLYNVSLTHSVKVKLSFAASPELQLEALGGTELTRHPATRAWTATIACPPHEVCPFLRFTLKAHPLVHEGIAARIIARSIQAIPYGYSDLLRACKAATTQAERELNALLAESARPRLSLTLSLSQRQQPLVEGEAEMLLVRCVEKRLPFVDLAFPPCQRSITGSAGGAGGSNSMLARLSLSASANDGGNAMRARLTRAVVWARPTASLAAFDKLPALVRLFRTPVSGLSVAGNVVTGNAWLLGAMACVAELMHEDVRRLFAHPSHSHAVAEAEHALGAYRVTLNKNGWWTNVIVDDYLPVLGSWPLFARSGTDCCELWVSILEKAYAKLCGGYECIASGDPLVALQDMTGFPCSRYDRAFAAALRGIIAQGGAGAVAAAAAGAASDDGQQAKGNANENPNGQITEGREQAAGFFERLARYRRHGFAVLLTTPPLPQLTPETKAALDEAGLLVGHSYVVRHVYTPQEHTAGDYAMEVLTARSAALEASAEMQAGVAGNESATVVSTSSTAVVRTVSSTDTGSHAEQPQREEDGEGEEKESAHLRKPASLYMNVVALQRCFSGCGVCFSLARSWDCRVRGGFVRGAASVCPLLSVAETVFVIFTLSVPPMTSSSSSSSSASSTPASAVRRPASAQAERNMLTGESYHPVLLSLCETAYNVHHHHHPHSPTQEAVTAAEENDVHAVPQMRVVCNTSLDADYPVPEVAFMRAGQVSMLCVLEPAHSPYLIVPRLMSDDSNNNDAQEKKGEATTVPYVVGIAVKDSQNEETASPYNNNNNGNYKSDISKVRIDFVRPPSAAQRTKACETLFATDGMQPVQTSCQLRRPNEAVAVTCNEAFSVTL